MMKNTKYLADSILKLNKFDLLDVNPLFPVVTLHLKDSSKYNVYQISSLLKNKGWLVPAYRLPPNASDMEVLRIVVKKNFDKSMINRFLEDLIDVL